MFHIGRVRLYFTNNHLFSHLSIIVSDSLVINIDKGVTNPFPSPGQDVVVNCHFLRGVNQPQPVWIGPANDPILTVEDGGTSRVNTQIVNSMSTQLNIFDVQPSDSGVYTCYVGQVTNTYTLIVVGKFIYVLLCSSGHTLLVIR